MTDIRNRLFSLRDEGFKKFNSALIPNIDAQLVIGVRTPELRKLAKELKDSVEATEFTAALPHAYLEENLLHAFLIGQIKDFDLCMEETERFLPCVDNWAVCDAFNPKVFGKHLSELLEYIRLWLGSEHIYTRRFAIVMLMRHYLDEYFSPELLQFVVGAGDGDYYLRMARAWYFATALAKQWDAALPVLSENRLDRWTHNKTIQKAVESYRISPEQKVYLKSLKR